jgi:hypothetical protein
MSEDADPPRREDAIELAADAIRRLLELSRRSVLDALGKRPNGRTP